MTYRRWQIAGIVLALVALALAVRKVGSSRNEILPSYAAKTEVLVWYSADLRYHDGANPFWAADERVEVSHNDLVDISHRYRGPGPVTRIFEDLPPGWHYTGVRGIRPNTYVLQRLRRIPAQRIGTKRVEVIDQIPLPTIEVDGVFLMPGPDSTATLRGPGRLLVMTSPEAKAERFGDEVAYTIPLGQLAREGRTPRVLIRNPDPSGPSIVSQVGDWISGASGTVFRWLKSILALIVATAIAAVVGPLAVVLWNKRLGVTARITSDATSEVVQEPHRGLWVPPETQETDRAKSRCRVVWNRWRRRD
jgi:hypothetical protein